ncbi:MAG: iron-containing alcohol dehydrogenase family protein, partial [Pirellulales bacterium]
PTLTVTQPPRVTALTGIDAVAHAVETYVTSRRNAVSLAFSREAWQLLAENFPKLLRDGSDLDARGGMQLGACFAGLAIENSMLGATHALANPLTAFYGIAHGQAVGMMLPHVIRFNGEEVDGWYRELLEYVPSTNGDARHHKASHVLADVVADFARQVGLPERLSECGVARDKLPVLAEDAAKQWTGGFNPRKVEVEDLLGIYEAAY